MKKDSYILGYNFTADSILKYPDHIVDVVGREVHMRSDIIRNQMGLTKHDNIIIEVKITGHRDGE